VIDYKALREQNAERLRTLKSEMAEHLLRHPELLLEQCRRLVAEQAKTKVVERSAQSIPVVTKRRDDSLVKTRSGRDVASTDLTEEQRWNNLDNWWDAKFLESFADAWPLMLEKIQSQFEATNAGLRAEISELREKLRNHVHSNNDEM
jgi:hypothetical protein